MEKIEIIIRENGTVAERTVTERDLKVEDTVLDALTAEVSRTMHDVLHVPDWGNAHASVGLNETIWSVPIDRIPLHARFRVINRVLVPMFTSNTDPEMPLVWRAPKDIHLVFVIQTALSEDADDTEIVANYLIAYNAEKNGYRLPLPNLHDDCMVCMGEFESAYKTAREGVVASLEQFNKSKWNADLMRTVEKSQKFFRFQPTNESFETLPVEGADWTLLCDKVSTALMERIVL